MKKRTLGILVGMATLGLAVYVGSKLWAQPAQLPAPPGGVANPRTKICLVNLAQVIQKYNKFLNYQNETKAQRESAQRTIEAKKKQVTGWQEALTRATDPNQKEQYTHAIRTAERELKDYTDEYNEKHAKAEVDLMVAIYKEIQDVVKRYAVARDIDLVLQYNDAITPAEFYNPQIFRGKLTNQALMPLVMAGGMDITDQIVGLMNQQYGGAAPTNATH